MFCNEIIINIFNSLVFRGRMGGKNNKVIWILNNVNWT